MTKFSIGAFTRKHIYESTTNHRYQASHQDDQDHIEKEKVDISFSNRTTKSTLFIDVFTVEQLLKQVVDDFLGRMRRKVVTLDYNFNKHDSKQEYHRYLTKKSIVQFTSDNNHKALTQYQRSSYAHNVIDTTELRQNQARALDWPYKTDDKKSCARIRPFSNHSTSCARSRPYETKSATTTQSPHRSIIRSSVNDLTQVLTNYNQSSENTNLTGHYAQSINYKQVYPVAVSCARTRPYPTVDTDNFRYLGKQMPSTSDTRQTDIKTMSCARCKNFNFCKNVSVK